MLKSYWAKTQEIQLGEPGRYIRAIPARYALLCVIVFGTMSVMWHASVVMHEAQHRSFPPVRPLPPLPPLYSQYHKALLQLPQHHWENDRPQEGEKFFFVGGHSRNAGWGDAMQELLLNSYLAYKAGRSFVFANYTWNDSGSLYSIFNGNRIPSQIPYSVMIRGPIVGDPFPTGTNGSLAVSRDYFEQVCPEKVTIWRGDVQSGLSKPLNAQAITNAWLSKLARIDDPCVQSEKASGQLYDFLVFGDSKAMLEIWPELIRSPILTHFGWSSLVELAFDTNRNFFFTSRVLEPYLSSQPFTTNADRYTMIPGLMAIHVRRGDYDEHCHNLARWGSTYLAMNSFPELLDRFTPSPHTMEPADIARVQELARPHCYPSVHEIVKRVRYVRATPAAQGVNKIYIMTNADTEFLSELTIALKHDAHWDSIATTRDMVLNLEQRYVSQAVDMLVGQRAQVFIGNGFSAVTSNVVTMRLANDFRSDSIRFW